MKEQGMVNQPIEVSFTANNAYIQHVVAVLQSILAHTSSVVNFHVVCNDIQEPSKRNLTKMLSKTLHSISFYVVDATVFSGFKRNIKYILLDTYFRFLLASLNPTLKKAIYLDADVILNGDLQALWDIELGDNYVGAVKDQYIENINYKGTIGLSQDEPYFNAGVLVLNLEAIRRDGLEQKFFANTKLLTDKMSYQDQDVLNYSFRGRVKIVPNKFNYMTSDVRNNDEASYKQAVIFHFTGPKKPWTKYNAENNPAFALYYKALCQTPYWKQFLWLVLKNPLKILKNTRVKDKKFVTFLGFNIMSFNK